MAQTIQRIFLKPPIAIARLGGSTTPQHAYTWVESPNPRSSGETTIQPAWSLVVESGGTVQPIMQDAIAFRDGAQIRPVCPFLELWALVGEAGSASSTWREVPVTPALLEKNGVALKDVLVRIEAKNFKASRRMRNPALQFGTFPPVEIRCDNHAPVDLLASSPPTVAASRRMIPPEKVIPLGSFQVLKSKPQPAPDRNLEWTTLQDGQPAVNVEVIRFRFTPARGHFYGPPSAAENHRTDNGGRFAPVESSRAFLREGAGWTGVNAENTAPDPPEDTYDGADVGSNLSLGVVDDTCEARIDVSFSVSKPRKQQFEAFASVFVGPPDFAPDRRPFVSLADELNDRSADSASRTAEMSAAERDRWVEDLFERVFETLSLFNLDRWRTTKGMTLSGTQLVPPIPHDGTRPVTQAMGSRDALRNGVAVTAPSPKLPLPLHDRALDRHRDLSDLEGLRDFVGRNPGRLAKLIRGPYEAEAGEVSTNRNPVGFTSMRMPPFMRSSNSGPLTLTAWQYELLMDWTKALEGTPMVAKKVARPMSAEAAARKAAVLARLKRAGAPGGH